MDFKKYLKEAKEGSKKRKFIQSIEMIFNFKTIDFSKQENRLNIDVFLPKGRGKAVACGVFADGALAEQAKKLGLISLSKTDLENLQKDKKSLKKIVRKCKFFLAQPDYMQIVAKTVGQLLGPKGKMPKPVPPTVDLEKFIMRFQDSTSLKSKGKFLPTVQGVIGSIEMTEDDLDLNANAVYSAVLKAINNNQSALKSLYIKSSMGPAVKVELPWVKKEEQ